jgi:putative ABC transport system permease protein
MNSLYLAAKEAWRHKGRFLLIVAVVALLTTLVLFVAALAEGLGNGNKEYLEKLNAELIAYKAGVDLSVQTSQLDRPKAREIRLVDGVKAVGQISASSARVVLPGRTENIGVSILGVEPGRPGEPAVVQGRQLSDLNAREALIDRITAQRTSLKVGDTLTLKTVQGSQEELYDLRVVGVTDGREFFLQPSVILPHLTWERVRPGVVNLNQSQMVSNIVAVQLNNPADWQALKKKIEAEVPDVQLVDRVTAYTATPGYQEQQNTLDTQKYFALFIGALVVGGFFQIQTLQKVPQLGMLKAVGASNWTIAFTLLLQIVLVTLLGVLLGTFASLGLALTFPPSLPIIFTGSAVVSAIVSLLLIGPLAGIISIRYALRVEPLMAMGMTG